MQLADFFVLPKIEILDDFVARALEVALPVAELPLEIGALGFSHDRGVALELLLLRAQLRRHRLEIALARAKLFVDLLLRGRVLRRPLDDAAEVDNADF